MATRPALSQLSHATAVRVQRLGRVGAPRIGYEKPREGLIGLEPKRRRIGRTEEVMRPRVFVPQARLKTTPPYRRGQDLYFRRGSFFPKEKKQISCHVFNSELWPLDN